MLPDHIRISSQPGEDLSKFLAQKKYSRVLVVADEHTTSHCYPLINGYLPEHTLTQIPSGEEHKTLDTCSQLWQSMTNSHLDRHSALIILGGGVLGDLGGFCASTYKRGIDFILVPTTLLAQADASIGGKLGVDFQYFKNHIGLFREPALNLLYSGFLKTLPELELRSGFAEVIKHALISDAPLWDVIRSKDLRSQDWTSLIRHSAEFKWSVVQKDPLETGLRKILNAGHTVGHALESHFLAKNQRILHGEAIAAGLVCEAYLANRKKLLDQTDLERVFTYVLKVFGKLPLPEDLQPIAALCLQDKKNKGNTILTALLDGIGRARWDCAVSRDEIVDSLTFYRSLQT